MSILLTFVASVILLSAAIYSFFVWLRIRNLGTLQITTSQVAYDEATFGHILTWDKYCFYIHGKPVWLISGEFHYWRLPDRNRWREVLMQYKAAGLNCIRIYFCWAYHSPDQGEYHFDGNRDIEYLMNLCEELELFVLAAPGPYICAETQAGGHPSWLVAKNVRLRHSVTTFFRLFDQEYTKYCIEWFAAILPILAKHQITLKPKGCVLALQIENEVFETMKGISVGLSDDMRVLSKAARDLGMNVPFFTNDAWEEGSFIAHSEDHRVWGKKTFGIDLYGFDKYVVFCPTSSPLAAVVGADTDMSKWKDWDPKDVTSAFDKTEKTVRGFGGGAAQSPIFIPELQGGWFNHYTVNCTFDDVYNYYGEDFTKMVVETSFSQGSTAFNLYMFYGGTNWGTLGDPDVYTSYDYSACLREFGHLAGKARLVRLAFAFAQSFSPEFIKTDANDNPVRSSYLIKSSIPDFIAKQRTSVGPNHVHFIFFRNFNKRKPLAATITLNRNHRDPVQLRCKLAYKQSFIGVANYKTANGLLLSLSTLPILLRTLSPTGQEVWFVQCDDVKNGQLAFQGGIEIDNGTLAPVTAREDDVSLVSFKSHSGWCKIQQTGISSSALYIIALTGTDVLSLHPIFREGHWSGKPSYYPIAVFWGAYQINFDVTNRKLTVDSAEASTKIFALTGEGLGQLQGFQTASNFVDFVLERKIDSKFVQPPIVPKLFFDHIKMVDFNRIPFNELTLIPNSSRPQSTPIDLCYTSGHTIYKLGFNLSSIPVKGLDFEINMRHRIAILLNNKSVGGHMTYALASLKPGSKNGPDLGNIAGWKKYILPSAELVIGKNAVYCIVESLGMNRGPGPIDDIRSPRGIMDVKIKGVNTIEWEISGIDVRKLKEVYNHSGIPDECQEWMKIPGGTSEIPDGIVSPTWYKGTFDYRLDVTVKAPLRLVVQGTNMAYIFVNDIFIARYYGKKQGPQNDFFIPPGLLQSSNSLAILTYGIGDDANLQVEFKLWKYATDASLISGSGNLDESGREFILNTCILKV